MRSKTALLLVATLLACASAVQAQPQEEDCDDVAYSAPNKKKCEGWFCPKRADCPRFSVVEEEGPAYQLRRYARTTWAVSCVHDAYHAEGVWRATARVLRYVKEEDLWGGSPFGHTVHLSLGAEQVWNASAGAGAHLPPLASEAQWGAGEDNMLHKTICAIYYLPAKYQGAPADSTPDAALDRRPPRPRKGSGVCIFTIRGGLEAYVSGFPGFPSPPRFIFAHMRLAHALKWEHKEFNWATASFLVYNPPSEVEHRWNEVLIPAGGKRFDELLLEEGEDVFLGEDGECGPGEEPVLNSRNGVQ